MNSQKTFVIDTNIILDDPKNIIKISEAGKNLIIIPETVIQELDKFKSGTEIINYNAREFARFLSDAKIIKNLSLGTEIEKDEIKIIIAQDTSSSNVESNDDKIIETGINFAKENNIENLIFISNDIYFRTKVILKNYKAESLVKERYEPVASYILDVEHPECFLNKEYFKRDQLEELLNIKIEDHIMALNITEYTGKKFILVRESLMDFRAIDLKSTLNLYGIKPRNLEQRIAWELISNNKNDIFIIDAVAGTGKTLMSLLFSMKLIDQNICNKIIYTRKTVISGNQLDELGFLPGNLQEKMLGYIFPLKDNIEILVKLKNKKKKKWSKEDLEKAVEDFENQYNIEYEYLGHMRGRNLSGIIIIDEAQNLEISSLITILSRVTEGSKVFIIGSTKQIDNPYLNKYNNALSWIKQQIGTVEPVQVQGINLTKVERGRIVDWVEHLED